MNKFIFGILIGAIIAFPLGMNVGKEKPLLSNPFADKQIGEQVKDTAERVFKETKKKVEETTGKVVEGTKEAIHEATKPEKGSEK